MSTGTDTELYANWSRWADRLHRLGLGNLAAWTLEAAGPLALLGAQALYFGGKLLRPALSDAAVRDLAGLLEDEHERLSFVNFLRKGEQA
jgi:hypothetical protein